MPKLIVVSYSELDTYRQCPLKHHLGYVQRWTKEKGEESALSKGTYWHQVQEAHHLTVQKHQRNPQEQPSPAYERAILADAREKVDELLFDRHRNPLNSNSELIDWMYRGYVEQYGIDREFTTVGVELGFQVPLPWPDGRPSHYVLKGKIDRLVKDNFGDLYVEDQKSCGNLPSDFEMQLDDQFGLYWWAIGQLGYKVSGALYSAARTTRNQADFPGYEGKSKPQTLEQRFQRYYLHRTEAELKALADDAFAAARNAHPPKGMALPLYSAPDVRQCGWKCDFKEAHLMLRQGLAIPYVMESEGFHQDFTRH